MNNYSGHMGYNQPYPPAAGQFPPPGPGYAPPAPTYPPAYQQSPAVGFVPPAGPAYPPAGPMYPPQNPVSMPEPYSGAPSASYPPPAANMPLPYAIHPVEPVPQPSAPAFNAYPPYGAPGAMPTSYPPAGPAAYPSAIPPRPVENAFHHNYPPAQPHLAPMPPAQSGVVPGYSAPAYHPLSTTTYDRGFQGHGTIKPFATFNAEHDSQVLRKAMKGLGTDEQTIISVLGYRCNQQRQLLKLTYKTLFGRDLVKDLSSELSFKFKQTVLASMMTPVEYDAEQLYKAIRGAGTNEEAIVEILCTRSNQQLRDIRTAYRNLYRNDLERDLIGDTSGHFRRFVVSLVTAGRAEGSAVDYERAKREAMELYQAGEARWGTDESKFNQVLCSNSHAQLRAVFAEYERVAHRSIHQSLSREMSGDLLMGMQTLANVVTNPHKYFADRLHRAMRGAGTSDDTLIRVIVSRSEVDLVQIKQEFQRQHGQTLESWIQGDTSGDYCRMLLALVTGN